MPRVPVLPGPMRHCFLGPTLFVLLARSQAFAAGRDATAELWVGRILQCGHWESAADAQGMRLAGSEG